MIAEQDLSVFGEPVSVRTAQAPHRNRDAQSCCVAPRIVSTVVCAGHLHCAWCRNALSHPSFLPLPIPAAYGRPWRRSDLPGTGSRRTVANASRESCSSSRCSERPRLSTPRLRATAARAPTVRVGSELSAGGGSARSHAASGPPCGSRPRKAERSRGPITPTAQRRRNARAQPSDVSTCEFVSDGVRPLEGWGQLPDECLVEARGCGEDVAEVPERIRALVRLAPDLVDI